ncbi:MAG: hypothetical protein ABW123_18780 [Cystobacter sp.]
MRAVPSPRVSWLLTLLCAPGVLALPASRPGPSIEAVQSCAPRSRGEACEVVHHARQLRGTCEAGKGEALSCQPSRNVVPPDKQRTGR